MEIHNRKKCVLSALKKDRHEMNCRLCTSGNSLEVIDGVDNREYFVCNHCMLINTHPDYLPDKETEREYYLTHQNGIEHSGYVEFLSRAINPALKYLSAGMTGLDYGCGYAPTLSKIMEEKGYRCEDYDPVFVKNMLDKKYDFIFSTETFEHFFHPLKDMNKIVDLLNESGLLIIMTERWKSKEQFSNWYYTKDPTHVAFYHDHTFNYICGKYSFEKLFDDGSRVIILRKL